MRQSQKIIKSIAFAVALLLVIMILSVITIFTYNILKALDIVKSTNTIQTNYTEKETSTLVKTLNIDLVNTNIYIKKGDTFKIECNNNDIEINNNDGYINIKDTSLNILQNSNKDIIIYIDKEIDFLSLETTNGVVKIDGLITNTLDLDLGIGQVEINNIEVLKELILNSGIGKTTISNSLINNIDADLGIGEFNFTGEILGTSKIDVGAGNSKILLNGDIDKYTINTTKGLGKITINNEELNDNSSYGNGTNIINIKGGIGNININLNKEV